MEEWGPQEHSSGGQGSVPTVPSMEIGAPLSQDHRPGSDSDLQAASLPATIPDHSWRAGMRRRQWLWGILIALFFAGWGLYTPGAYNAVETDAARHAMNGVFLLDMVRHGELTHAMTYARTYYAHLPALSMPYHPPLFPLMEAVFYLIFGVSVFSARLAVAATVAGSALALYCLVLKTHRSVWIAALSTITFLCLPEALGLSSDVMLEFPALMFTLFAIGCLRPADRQFGIVRALCFAVLAGAAVWSKQLTVFLGALPFLYLMFLGKWRTFLKPAIWVGTAAFGALVGALISLSVPVHGAGITQAIPAAKIPIYVAYYRLLVRNSAFYASHYYQTTGPAGLILMAAFVGVLLAGLFLRGRPDRLSGIDQTGSQQTFWKESALYLAWTVTSLGVLFILRPYDTRYMFVTYPALIVLGYGSVFRMGRLLPAGNRIAVVAGVAITVLAVVQFPHRTQYLHGPEKVAGMLAPLPPGRILYCGGTDGSFILSYRAAHPMLDSTIIPGDKLPNAVFAPAVFDQFAHDYGVNYVVIEDATGWQRPWKQLIDAPLPAMVLERQFDLASSSKRWNGSLRVYRFTNPSPQPKSELAMRMFMVGGTMDFHIGH